MNIFWLDLNPEKNVEAYVDKHVVKMITEYAQLLSSACRLSGVDCGYQLSHQNHPCAIWCRKSLSNWNYLRKLSAFLYKEYLWRYGENKTHKSFNVIYNLKSPNIPDIGITMPPQCMPDIYKCDNLIIAYRNYYIGDKVRIARWTRRNIPKWFNYNGVFLPCSNSITNKNDKYRINMGRRNRDYK